MSLFDTYAVWLEVQKHPNNVTKTDVADVLDAIVAIERRGEAANDKLVEKLRMRRGSAGVDCC